MDEGHGGGCTMDSSKPMKYFTGVGSRNTPYGVMDIIYSLSWKLKNKGYLLRSGGANGADTSFEEAFLENYHTNFTKNIYIPWDGFNSRYEEFGYTVARKLSNHGEALRIAESVHPAWDRCSSGAKLLHARNVYQVLGHNLDDPSKFLICWAEEDKNGNIKGGTQTAWKLAEVFGVPRFNLYRSEDFNRIISFLNKE